MAIRPETLVRWHRADFRRYWRKKSRRRGGRPRVETEQRALIRRMSIENPLWGAPRIHSELLKLGFEVAQSSVARYMVKRRVPPRDGEPSCARNQDRQVPRNRVTLTARPSLPVLPCRLNRSVQHRR
jgi:hypothetical protein